MLSVAFAFDALLGQPAQLLMLIGHERPVLYVFCISTPVALATMWILGGSLGVAIGTAAGVAISNLALAYLGWRLARVKAWATVATHRAVACGPEDRTESGDDRSALDSEVPPRERKWSLRRGTVHRVLGSRQGWKGDRAPPESTIGDDGDPRQVPLQLAEAEPSPEHHWTAALPLFGSFDPRRDRRDTLQHPTRRGTVSRDCGLKFNPIRHRATSRWTKTKNGYCVRVPVWRGHGFRPLWCS